MSYEEMEQAIAAWAATRNDIRAVIALGSRARGDQDAWSDLDIIVFTTDRQRYAADAAWLEAFGKTWVTYQETTGHGDPEWFAVYEGGLKLDAVLLPVDNATLDLDTLLTQYPYQGAFGRGIHVLYDRQGMPRHLPPKPFVLPAPPSAAEFDHAVSGFLMSSVTVAKFIARGDFYRAQRWFANDLHVHLLKLIEWNAYGKDTWYGGRFIERWAGERERALLDQTFAHSDYADLRRALLTMLDGFSWLGQAVAERFQFRYPVEIHRAIQTFIVTTLPEKP